MQQIGPTQHPLDGKYIIFNYGEQDTEDVHWALALYRLSNFQLKELYHPGQHYPFGEMDSQESLEDLLQIIKKNKIKEVYSVFSTDDFFGLPHGCKSLDDKETETIETWFEYKSICRDGDEAELLAEKGISLHFYFADQNEFSKKE